MALFVDTSALFAAMDAEDSRHEAALRFWEELAKRRETPITTNYVLVETAALVTRRLGFQAVRDLLADVAPLLQVHWVDQAIHEQAVAVLLTAGRRDLSLVDCVSFGVMRQLGLDTVFAFDAHLAEQGFQCVP